MVEDEIQEKGKNCEDYKLLKSYSLVSLHGHVSKTHTTFHSGHLRILQKPNVLYDVQ